MLTCLCSASPFARYHSRANSFPDYGALDGKMRRDLMKQLNAGQTTTINTLSRSTAPNTLRSNDGPPVKKQRRDSVNSSDSPYFPPPRISHVDSIQDGSPDDPFDIKSISSAGNYSNHAPATVPEYRKAGVRAQRNTRRRRSRQQVPNTRGLLITKGKNDLEASNSPDSPDVLTMDEPPPANITSDIPSTRGNSKRGRLSDQLELPFKRPKSAAAAPSEEIDDSEDELSVVPQGAKGAKKQRRLTNFDSVESRLPGRRAASKGNIEPTTFRSSKKSDSTDQSAREFVLKEAVTGFYHWEPTPGTEYTLVKGDEGIYHFSLDGNRVSNGFFDIDPATLQNIFHAAPKSCYMVLQRRTKDGCPPKMLLEFDSCKHASTFIQTASFGNGVLRSREPEDLEKQFLYGTRIAKKYQSNNSINGHHIQQVSDVEAPDSSSTLMPQERDGGSRTIIGDLEVPRRMKLTEKLATAARSRNKDQDPTEHVDDIQLAGRSLRSNTGATRRTQRTSPDLTVVEKRLEDRWSFQNSGWEEQWQKSLVYPATGKNRATVDANDIVRLDEGEFLNDNLISFYLRYLQVKLEQERPEILKKVHIFSTFFFEKLKSSTKYDGVRGWTAKIDLFSYDYIVVPVNEKAHWYLAIICNVPQTLFESQPLAETDERVDDKGENAGGKNDKALKASSPQTPKLAGDMQTISIEDDPISPSTVKLSDGNQASSPLRSRGRPKAKRSASGNVAKFNPKEPKIITLDSLGNSHSVTCRTLREYLENEARDKKEMEIQSSPRGMKGNGIPQQDNWCDCGVFILGYMEEFLRNPDEAAQRLLRKEDVEWNIKPQQMRNDIRELLFDLQNQQQVRLASEQAEKKASRLKRKGEAGSNSAAPTSSAQSLAPSSSPTSQGPRALQPSSPKSAEPPSKDNSTPAKSPPTLPAATASTPPKGPEPTEETRVLKKDKISHPKTAIELDDDPPTRISPLGDVSSDVSGDAFYSAPASPESKLVNRGKPPSLLASTIDSDDFVQPIPSSGSEGETSMKKKSKGKDVKIRPSIEVDDDEHQLLSIGGGRQERYPSYSDLPSSAYFKPKMPDIPQIMENSIPNGPRYEGIERSMKK